MWFSLKIASVSVVMCLGVALALARIAVGTRVVEGVGALVLGTLVVSNLLAMSTNRHPAAKRVG